MTLDVRPEDDPLAALGRWYREAEDRLPKDEADAIALATVDARGRPAVRIVLCRAVTEAGELLFYTNYDSRKGRDIDAMGQCAVVFHWRAMGRQLRVEGPTTRCSAAQSDAYWSARPRESRLSAIASPQSREIESYEALDRHKAELREAYADRDIPRPENWGGYVLTPLALEFWQDGASRLHERVRFERPDLESAQWSAQRLGP
jgi:pyridoxamine 5'-phosphate oxidase